MIKTLKELIKWLKEYEEWYNANYGPQTQDGPGENPHQPPPPPPGPTRP